MSLAQTEFVLLSIGNIKRKVALLKLPFRTKSWLLHCSNWLVSQQVTLKIFAWIVKGEFMRIKKKKLNH